MATTTLRLPSRATRTRKADSVGWGSPLTYFIAFVFVAICIGAALAVRPGDFFGIGVLPPLLLLGCAALLSLLARDTVAHRGDGFVQGVVSALASHSGALAAGYVLCLLVLAIRTRVAGRPSGETAGAHSNRVGSPAP